MINVVATVPMHALDVDIDLHLCIRSMGSMLQDVEAGRSTEIDYITGYLLRTAERLGVNAPLNRKLYQEIIALG